VPRARSCSRLSSRSGRVRCLEKMSSIPGERLDLGGRLNELVYRQHRWYSRIDTHLGHDGHHDRGESLEALGRVLDVVDHEVSFFPKARVVKTMWVVPVPGLDEASMNIVVLVEGHVSRVDVNGNCHRWAPFLS